jgi:hypothetical protein
VLLDGLDETEGKPVFLSALRTALSLFKTCPIVITCRTVSFEQHRALCPDFAVFTLAGLTDTQREAYIRAFPAQTREKYDPDSLLEQLRRAPQLRPLTANPLLLSVFCAVATLSRAPVVPRTRSALYQRMLERLLSNHTQRVAVQYPSTVLDVTDKLAILRQTAFLLFTKDGQRLTISAEELRQAFITALERERYGYNAPALWASALRKDFAHNSGILRGDTEQGFFFLHLTVQEFLVAATLAHVINKQGWDARIEVEGSLVNIRDVIDRKAWDPRWQEVIIFLAGQLAAPFPLFTLLTQTKQDDLFRHRLALAAMCLPEVLGVDRQLASVADRITTEAITCWLQHEQRGTKAAIPHLTRALPILGVSNGCVKRTPLWQWLCQQLRKRHRTVRASAIEALGQMGEVVAQRSDVLSALVAALQDRDALIRIRAVAALRRTGRMAGSSPQVLSALTQVAKHDEERFVRLNAKRALE